MSVVVFIASVIGLGINLWVLYSLNKELFVLLGGFSLALIMTTYLNITMKYYLDKKDNIK
jgi:hypothetical protein